MFMGQRWQCHHGVGQTTRSDCTPPLIPPLQERFRCAHAVSPLGLDRQVRSHRPVRPVLGREDWTRRGTEGFLGQHRLPGARQSNASALILMGDWYAAA